MNVDTLDCLARFERSGLQIRERGRRNGIDGLSLNGWRMSTESKPPKRGSFELPESPDDEFVSPRGGARHLADQLYADFVR